MSESDSKPNGDLAGHVAQEDIKRPGQDSVVGG